MNLSTIFSIVDAWQLLGALAVGVAVGLLLVRSPHVPPRHRLILFAEIGAVFFVNQAIYRALEQQSNWERTIGLGFVWLVYVVGIYVGLVIRERRDV